MVVMTTRVRINLSITFGFFFWHKRFGYCAILHGVDVGSGNSLVDKRSDKKFVCAIEVLYFAPFECLWMLIMGIHVRTKKS